MRLEDVAEVTDGSEDIRNTGLVNGKPAILLLVWRQPDANIIDTVDRVRAVLPQLQNEIPPTINLLTVIDRTTTIRASVHEVQFTLGLSIVLVILVVFVFFRNARTALIPSVVVPVSLIGTFGAMYLLGYSINNLSLMALTIATGFVVDDAIVVIENIMRHLGAGDTAVPGGVARRQRNWLHGRLDHLLSPGGVHSYSPDGRDLWASLPGIRRDPGSRSWRVDGGLPHDDPDDVCLHPPVLIATRDTDACIVPMNGCSRASSACTR